ncbi:hypothetical protein FIBSPDRAFT_897201 [Athelia psychrophila]|uniref:Uncharacterized protein n=1 Tax=Athelia psychrophila TaxID=1759441 RepID=A0A166CGU8_9AGAM|nr:hypothetical protein FIBSPDRAFT_897201 [Fibularhizoctonia sp. CBS 109695]
MSSTRALEATFTYDSISDSLLAYTHHARTEDRIPSPVVVVFTKFDYLVTHSMMEIMDDLTDEELEMEDDKMEVLAHARAEKSFETICVRSLHQIGYNILYTKVSVQPQYRQTLANLIEITQNLVSLDEGDVWVVSVMAQKASNQVKINMSINPISYPDLRVGMRRYWQRLASSDHFMGYTLETCLNTIHSEIVSGWNLYDPENLLDDSNDPKFRNQIMAFAQDVAPEDSEASSRFPNVLHCLMGHIVNLTLVMDSLFLKPHRRLTWEIVHDTLEEYRTTRMPEVHRQIRDVVPGWASSPRPGPAWPKKPGPSLAQYWASAGLGPGSGFLKPKPWAQARA